jgi:tetratricopeptide (TPR) repeat protein
MTHRSLWITLTILTFEASAFAQEDGKKDAGFFDQALVTPRIIAARHEFNENNMRGAMLIYREVLQAEPNNANALYGTAECYYYMKKYKLSLDYLERALAVNSNVSHSSQILLGQIYHRSAQLDKAIDAYKKFLATENDNTYEYHLASAGIAQCLYAKDMMEHPVPVVITNLGNAVNSRFDDYTPSISADGKLLLLTARRDNTTGGRMDEAGDYKYFEDIYYSIKDPDTGEWTESLQVPGAVNTETYDAVLSIMPNGKGMFVYKNTVNTTGDIYYSELLSTDSSWTEAQKMPRPINTSYFEGSASITADGNTLYFISERPNGLGLGDIYVSTKTGENWSTPKNLGPIVNTEEDEKFVFIHPSGRTLYFASEGHQTMGSYDIFKSEFVNGEWSLPINLGYPINTVNEESTFSLTSDNQTMYIAAEYDDTYGERDLYTVDVANYPLISKGHEMSTFGQLMFTITLADNSPAKSPVITAFLASSGVQVAQIQGDKLGMAKLNLPGNQRYRIVISADKKQVEKVIDLTLQEKGETIVQVQEILR